MPVSERPFPRLLELLALCSLAIAEPVLRVFGQSPTTFLANDVTGLHVVWFALLVGFAPPLVLFAIEQTVDRLTGAGPLALIHRIFLAILAGSASMGLLARFTGLALPTMIVIAAIVGLLFLQVFERVDPARDWVRMLSVGPFVFVGLFLFASPAGDLVDQVAVAPVPLERDDEAGPSGAETDPLPDVVLVVFDELPLVSLLDGSGSIDAGLYPNFGRLASTSTWFRNTITVSDNTRFAVPAALSGQMPPPGDLAPTAQNHPETIFTLLGDAYRLDVWERLQLCPVQLCPRSSSGSLTDLLGDAGEVLNEQLDGEPEPPPPLAALGDRDESLAQADRLESFVEALAPADDGRPTLHFIHVLLPHRPWQLMPSGAAYADPAPVYGMELEPLVTWGGEELADLGRRRHGLQLQYADLQLGGILDHLESQGRFDETVVAVTADHGIGFIPGGSIRDFELMTAPEVAWVPMLVKGSDQTEPFVSDAPATTLDLVPTLAERIGVVVPWETDGRPLAPDEIVPAERSFSDLSRGGELDRRIVPVPDSLFAEVLRWDPIGWGTDPDLALYRTEVHPELVGLPIDRLSTGDPSPATIDLRSEPTPTWDGTGRIPTWIDADITGAALGDPVAVIVNGRVGAVATVTDATDRPAAVSAVVPESMVVRGRNEIRFALVEADDGDPTLHEVSIR